MLTGVVTVCRPSGALWEVTVRAGGHAVTGRLGDAAAVGSELTVTVLDPPVFLAGDLEPAGPERAVQDMRTAGHGPWPAGTGDRGERG